MALSTGLAHVTINSPQRRVDVALPAGVPLAELLPELLAHAGDGLADDGERHGGWLLRRSDGTALSPATALAAQGVRDGAVLYLVPARTRWPEVEYDDVVEAIADGARRYGTGWSPTATRTTGLAVAGVALALGLVAAVRSGSAPVAAVIGVVLVLGGAGASRVYGNAVVGAALAAFGLPYALLAGWLSAAEAPMTGAGSAGPPGSPSSAERWLVGSSALLLASVVAAIGVAYALRLFVAGATAGVLGVAGAPLGLLLRPASAAAIVLALLVAGVAAVPLLAIRLGKLPVPVPPRPDPPPERRLVLAAVARTDEMLTGMLLGVAVMAAAASLVLARSGDVSGRFLVGVAALAFLLRARTFVAVRHRLPLLGAGLAGLVVLAAGLPGSAALALLSAAIALTVAGAGVRFSLRPPSPYLGRGADLLDVLCVISVVPLGCAVLGLYGAVRGLGG